MSRFIQKITSFAIISGLVLSLVSITGTSVSALETAKCDKRFDSANNVLYYDQCDPVCSPSSSTSVIVGGGTSLPAETVSYLDGRGIKNLATQNQARYDYASSQTKVPWQVIAALHYREAGMSATQSVYNGAALGSGINVDGQNVVSDANTDATNAATTFIGLAQGVYNIDVTAPADSITLEQWGNAFLAYNRGYLYKQNGKTYDQSPYVMNGFDTTHMNMSWVGKPADPAASGVDGNKAGALAVLVYLGGAQLTSNCSTSGAVAGDMIKTALNYARDTPAPDGMTSPTDAKETYRKAIVEFNGTTATYPEITDCGRFISTILHASNVDANFPAVSVTAIINYMNSNSKYQSLGALTMMDMQPGDIIATPDHIMMYTGTNGSHVAVDASYQERVPSVRTAASVTWMVTNGASVWRLK